MGTKRLGTRHHKVSVLLKVSRPFFPDSCPTSRAGITEQQPQLAPGQLSRGGKATAFCVPHGKTKVGKQRKSMIHSVQSKPCHPSLHSPGSGVCTWSLPGVPLIPSSAPDPAHLPGTGSCIWGGAGTSRHAVLHPTRNLLWERNCKQVWDTGKWLARHYVSPFFQGQDENLQSPGFQARTFQP